MRREQRAVLAEDIRPVVSAGSAASSGGKVSTIRAVGAEFGVASSGTSVSAYASSRVVPSAGSGVERRAATRRSRRRLSLVAAAYHQCGLSAPISYDSHICDHPIDGSMATRLGGKGAWHLAWHLAGERWAAVGLLWSC